MRIESLETIRSLMLRALEIRGIHGQDAAVVVEDYVSAALAGDKASGIDKFVLIDLEIGGRTTPPKIVRQGDCYALVDANKELGQLASKFCVELLSRMARLRGMFAVGMFNSTSCGRLRQFGSMIADHGLVGLIVDRSSSAGTSSAGIAPQCGSRVCFAFPKKIRPLILEVNPGAGVRGRQRGEGEPGSPEPSPGACQDELSTLCLALEILAGALVTSGMEPLGSTPYDQGAFFLGVNPPIFAPLCDFERRVEALLEPNLSSQMSQGARFGRAEVKPAMDAKEGIEVEDRILERLLLMSDVGA